MVSIIVITQNIAPFNFFSLAGLLHLINYLRIYYHV